ncbi:MAG: tRNA (adenosine(37)-N6)-threonylcarbamoyltransferase complex transferase subunit TsaD [Rhodospirillaceae bacterium]|nr:tRNA (adenosine(37)-N6)-threonylcarbamoyltransferase complex transferase subunit TsaD [Rhodospirillaceae bacterium]
MIVLGIETSCDETSVALVGDDRRVHAHITRSQLDLHRAYGGVVPEIAARDHLAALDPMVRQALAGFAPGLAGVDAVAATAGPGLIGGVLVGTTYAKGLALARGLPFFAINHLEGHALTPRLTADPPPDFPYLLLLVSGGHCQLLVVHGVGRYRRLGTTVDDAVGEAFDKVAKLLGLGYPGGPEIEAAARTGDPGRFPLPAPMVGRRDCHFSFSGLKAAVRRLVDGWGGVPPDARAVADVAASFQAAVAASLRDRTGRAIEVFRGERQQGGALVVAGGVAANAMLRAELSALAATRGLCLLAPPLALCTDNAAMIAWAALERRRAGLAADPLEFRARPRWPLDPDAPPAVGAGVKA